MKFSITQVAAICHAANQEYRAQLSEPGDNPDWLSSPQSTKDSVIAGVQLHVDALKGWPKSPPISPSASHDSWLAAKREAGWKYGPVKDEVLKEHPCFLPYDKLPAVQRAKDYMFGSIIWGLFVSGMIEGLEQPTL